MTMASAPGGPGDHSDPAAPTGVQESPLFVDLPAVGESQSCDCGNDHDVVVVNELLCFVTNKIDVMTQDVLVKLLVKNPYIRAQTSGQLTASHPIRTTHENNAIIFGWLHRWLHLPVVVLLFLFCFFV